ncbi:bifunctional 2-polyprenyl-6-hydroxyphenol methylase/3-demethylubiquinol 3-O-methyltransferase UbiG [Spiribacter sp. SSL99]|uniref:class I SAM-dependent methyltransferase n=1 Tax=Spiribacter sp. SSL99 TaxID=1866884 RepID=UPI0013302089|nr:methyltransferase domain-containing protein [Spiribacter sp. SSL99]
MIAHLQDQKENWAGAYVQGYFYQGLECLGISGAKPTGFRFAQYDVDEILKGSNVLDIGSNTGFVAIWCAKLAKSVTGIELNPYLNKIAREAADHLSILNVAFCEEGFEEFDSDRKFDVILSLSNHHTIDGNLNLGFEKHMQRISNLLEVDGYMLFESHNVFGRGDGGTGDDGDMDKKIRIMSNYFKIERYKMVRKFLRYSDVDKLFIVARKSPVAMPIKFDLAVARQDYSWTTPSRDE